MIPEAASEQRNCAANATTSTVARRPLGVCRTYFAKGPEMSMMASVDRSARMPLGAKSTEQRHVSASGAPPEQRYDQI